MDTHIADAGVFFISTLKLHVTLNTKLYLQDASDFGCYPDIQVQIVVLNFI